MDDTAKPFTAYDIEACLFDAERVHLFRDAIERTVRPGDVVVDAGSGSGLLGMFAAQAGASKVYCVEFNREYIEVIKANAERNGFGDVIEAVHADATKYKPPTRIDVIVCEVISGGFFHEPQVQILANLRQYLADGARIVPHAVEHFVELLEAQEEMYGFTFTFDGRYRELPDDRPLSDRASYLIAVSHDERSEPNISTETPVLATASGKANAIRIPYRIEMTPGVWADARTEFLMNPQVVFLPEPITIQEGQWYEVALAYQASSSPRESKVDVRPTSPPAAAIDAPYDA